MAKTKTYDTDFTWEISPNVKKQVFKYTGNTAATANMAENLPNDGRDWDCQNFATQVGNDLVITTKWVGMKADEHGYWNTKPTVKTTQTVFKNYFADGAPDLAVTFSTPDEIYGSTDPYTIHPYTSVGDEFFFGESGGEYVTVPTASKTFDITTYQKYFLSQKGNYTYNIIDTTGWNEVYDLAGNDTYNFQNTYSLYVEDYNGKDTYNLTGTNDWTLSADDIQGNDTYNVSGYGSFDVYEYSGKDKYNFSNFAASYSTNTRDYCGNDKYSLNEVYGNEKLYFGDFAGKDSWSLTDTYGLEIEDYKGKDTYTVKDTYSTSSSTDIKIYDYAGNDSYKFQNVTQSYDTWWYDYDGKDKYTFTGCYGIEMNDDGTGNDKYTLTNCSDMYIRDYSENGKDTYTVTNCTGGSFYLEDYGGNDKYTFNGNEYIWAEDYSTDSNDSYTVKNLIAGSEVRITDHGGAKDSLTISGLKKSNMGIVFDLAHSDNGSAYIVDMSTGGYVKIDNYFEQAGDNTFSGLGDGCIETIKAGVKIKSSTIENYMDLINGMQYDMVSWFSGAGSSYSNIQDVLDDGNINALLNQHLVVTQDMF